MYSSNPFARIISLIVLIVFMISIFSLITWRGTTMFGIHLKWEHIILIALWFIAVMIGSFMLWSLPGKGFEIAWAVLLWVIYGLIVLSPLLMVRDIVSIRYKVPALIMGIACLLWIGFGLYMWTTTKVTPLSITDTRISKPVKIAFVSDFHVDAIRKSKYIQRIVDQLKSLQPDFILLWWDLFNTAKLSYADAFVPFDQLTMPVYATLGNHDNMGESGAVAQLFAKTKIIPLRNQSIVIDGIQVVGIDDKSYREKKTLTGILDESKIGNEGLYTILVSHQPQHLGKLAKYPIDLELAGHTHHGQFIPFSWIIWVMNDYAYGRYEREGKIAFVSQGVGAWWAPIRIGTQSEIVMVELKAE